MSLERRLREHFEAARSALPAPDAHLDKVVKRGRRRVAVRNGAVAAGTLVVGAAVVFSLRGLSGTDVEFVPASPAPPTSFPTPAPSDAVITGATPPPTEGPAPAVEMVALDDLGGPVIAYGGSTRDLKVYDEQGGLLIRSGRVDAALSDGRGGVVVQAGKDLTWFASPDPRQSTTLVESDEPIELRSVLADGRAVYSIVDSHRSEDMREHFYAVPLTGGPTETLGDEFAFESWRVGPAVAAGQRFVLASCHLLCTLYEWFPGGKESQGERLYHGGGAPQGPGASIEGLTATPDGQTVGLVEGHPSDGIGPPELVLLDGSTFERRTAIRLPVGDAALGGPAAVSLSSTGQRVLVSVGPAPTRPGRYFSFLIEDALSKRPRMREVDFDGIVRWLE